jgi:predicted HTH transcriptional regulator
MFTDEELALRIVNFEDNFVERKSIGDNKRWIPALVAFANSAPIGFPCVLFIGVKDDGTLEKDSNLESLQKTFNEKAAEVFPRIPYYSKILTRDGKQCLAIIVPGSSERPHYAGLPYMRIGAESRKADVEAVERMTAERDPKAYEILKWKGKSVSMAILNVDETARRMGRVASRETRVVRDCNQHWVTLEFSSGQSQSFVLGKVELSFDHEKNRLELQIAS